MADDPLTIWTTRTRMTSDLYDLYWMTWTTWCMTQCTTTQNLYKNAAQQFYIKSWR